MVEERAEFGWLSRQLDISDSALSKHLAKLEEAGYVSLRKGVSQGQRCTWVRLTTAGRGAFDAYAATLQRLIAPAAGADSGGGETPASSSPPPPPDWRQW